MKRKMCLLLCVIAILVSACSAVHKSLHPDLITDSLEVHLISIIPQDSIKINIVESMYDGFGLLEVLIDDVIDRESYISANELLSSFNRKTRNVDFKSMYWKKLENTFSQSKKMVYNEFEKKNEYSEAEFKEINKPYLKFETDYELSPNARAILIITKAELYITDSKKPDYYGDYVYISDMIAGGKELSIPQALELWHENDNAKYREILNEGIEQNMFMFKHDLLDRFDGKFSESSKKVRMLFYSPSHGYHEDLYGKLVLEDDKRIIVRRRGDLFIRGGNLFSIGKGSIHSFIIYD